MKRLARWLFYLIPLAANAIMALLLFLRACLWPEVPTSLAITFGIWLAWSSIAFVRHFFHL